MKFLKSLLSKSADDRGKYDVELGFWKKEWMPRIESGQFWHMHHAGLTCEELLVEYGERDVWEARRPWSPNIIRAIEERCQCLRIAKELGVPKTYFDGKRILEIGPGLISALSTVKTNVKVAIEPLAKEFGREGFLPNDDIIYLACRAEDMPLPESFFDVVISRNNFDHVDDPAAVVCEMARVLRTGGEVCLIVHLEEKPSATEPHTFTELRLKELFHQFELVSQQVAEGGRTDAGKEFRGIFKKRPVHHH